MQGSILYQRKKGENKLGRLAINPNDRLSDTATPSLPKVVPALRCSVPAVRVGQPPAGATPPSPLPSRGLHSSCSVTLARGGKLNGLLGSRLPPSNCRHGTALLPGLPSFATLCS